MNDNILSWNIENWITVVLMAAIGFTVLGLAQRWIKQRKSAE